LALLTNAAFIFAVDRNLNELLVPIWFWFSIGISFPFFIRRWKQVPLAFFLSFSFAISSLSFGYIVLAHSKGSEVVEYVKSQLSVEIDHLTTIPEHPIKTWVAEQGKTEVIHEVMAEIPSVVMIALILCYWFNLLLTFRVLPGFLSHGFWGAYRNPEWLVWPTIVCAILYAFGDHALYYVGMNGLKVLLVFYGFQGLSIVAFFLNRKQVFGIIRAVIFGLLVFLASPFALALGFFDQWFDFRRKFGQS